jgi:hypothetical protein
VVSPRLVLLTTDGEPFGDLEPDGAGGARLRAGDLEAHIGPRAGGGYTMTAGNDEILVAGPSGSGTVLDLRFLDPGSGERSYGASISLLRGEAVARRTGGGEIVRISGGLTNRRYEATFVPEDPASLPMATFLLNHAFTLRRAAFRTGP